MGLDVQPLLAKSPGGMYRLTLSFRRPHVAWPCEAGPAAAEPERPAPGADEEQEQSYWDSWAENEDGDWDQRFENRDNPCHPAYYQRFYDHDIRAARNVLVSDLGLMAKAGEDDAVLVFVTDLRTTDPVAGAEVTLLDYQQQTLATARTDRDGHRAGRRSRAPRSSPPCGTAARPATCASTTAPPSRWPTSTWPAPAPRRASRASSTASAGSGARATRCTSPSSSTTPRRGSRPTTPCASTSWTPAASSCGP